ncbi:hypothetical protein CPLU01_15462 [Colletotrichum plurivorum]|uniref:GPI inositol-deacylase winged helix domain-containing protein n=1 Tax=Colletotrichum plurivorum TaxID=2175906 RepID=A0A8H6JBS1_9PEZI|nr:hypothetical protein CPLU01_15462 [Colletotrichum plurivorum]
MKNSDVDQDIANFVAERLHSDVELQRLSKYHPQIKDALSERARGVFRWVECQFIELVRCPPSDFLIQKQLDSLPETLDDTYARMLKNIPSVAKEHAQQMFAIICCATSPLTVPELIDALAVDAIEPLAKGAKPRFDKARRLEDADALRQVCPGLLLLLLLLLLLSYLTLCRVYLHPDLPRGI